MRKSVIVFLAIVCLCACSSSPFDGDPTFGYAKQEVAKWTSELQSITPLDGKRLKVEYKCDPAMDSLG